jgi:N-acetylglucosamine-6-sulfatase
MGPRSWPKVPLDLLHRAVAGVAVVLAADGGFLGVARGQPDQRPNILLLYVDDLRHDGLGVTGHPFVETPNLDNRIAGQGVNFVNSFVNCPLCSPSRASLMTGQYAVTHGLNVNDDINGVPDERLPIYQKTLQAAGYRTGLVGKWHMDSYFEPREGFDYWAAFQGQGTHLDPTLRVKQDDAPVRTVNEKGFTTSILTEYALDFLNDYGPGGSRTEPFALTLSFKAVHAPHGPEYTESGGVYEGETIDRPPNAQPSYGGYDINEEKPVYSLNGAPGLTLNTTMGNAIQTSQMEMMHDIDANIGLVLDALEAKGLDDNTLVIFTSDNGFFWGEHGRGDKRLVYEESLRVPLLMRGPGVVAGQSPDALVANIDIAPTILRAAGVEVPASMQGRPLNGLLSGSEAFSRDAVYAEYYPEVKHPTIPRWDAVRTDTHVYVTHPDAGLAYDELYDLANDPYQMNNLLLPGPISDLPVETQQVLDTMQIRLQELRRQANSVNPFDRRVTSGSLLDFTVTEGGIIKNGTDALRVGSDADANGSGFGRSAVLAYELPPVEDPAALDRAFVSFHIVRQTGNVSQVNADLWAIGITDGDTRLNEYLEANTEVDLPDRADNLKLQDNIIKAGNHLARTFSDDEAATLLAGYLRTFYESRPNYAGGSFLQVRLNADRDLGTATAGWDISAMEAPTSATNPAPFTFRQPALVLELAVDRSVITLHVGNGMKNQDELGYPIFSGAVPLVKTGMGTLVVDRADAFTGAVTVDQGEVRIASGDAFKTSHVAAAAGARVTVAPGVKATVGGLSPLAGLIDLGSGAITVTADLAKDDMLAALRSGRGNGSWNGSAGITSSEAAASGGARTVGWLEHGDGSVTVAYAAAGDTNLDWSIDIIDVMNIVAGGKFNSGLAASWRDGDFNADGLVDGLDFVAMMSSGLYARGPYNGVGIGAGSGQSVAAVPEPNTAWVAATVAMAAGIGIRGRSRR